MGRKPCCSREKVTRGAWSAREDRILASCISAHGEGQWRSIPEKAGLNRCGKSCRLRWLNYLRPGIKRDEISEAEEDLIVRLHRLIGNRWSLIARRLPGRTDNQIKNYWNSTLSKKAQKMTSYYTCTQLDHASTSAELNAGELPPASTEPGTTTLVRPTAVRRAPLLLAAGGAGHHRRQHQPAAAEQKPELSEHDLSTSSLDLDFDWEELDGGVAACQGAAGFGYGVDGGFCFLDGEALAGAVEAQVPASPSSWGF